VNWKSVRVLVWDPKGERKWWPDFIFVPLAVALSGSLIAHHQWVWGILAGAFTMGVDEALFYLLRTRRRHAGRPG